MKDQYRNLFKSLIESYYNGNFEDEVKFILSQSKINKKELCKIISSLCGTSTDCSSNFTEDLKKAIKSYKPDGKIVNKVKFCTMECMDKTGKTLCQKSCPFDAILMDAAQNSIHIDKHKCTDCGFCVEACPTGGIMDKVQFLPLANILKGNSPVIAIVAPAIIGQFGKDVTLGKLRSAFKKLGFTDMIEVAFFADMLTLKEAIEFDNHIKDEKDFMITSCCCPMWVGMLKKIYNNLIKYVSPSVSPMAAGGRVLKKLNPNCKVVFIGPCIAKKSEAKEKDIIKNIDFVLTFSEVKDIFDTLNIHPNELKEEPSTEYASSGGRLYARTGGVSIAVSEAVKRIFPEKYKLFKAVKANGVKECKSILSRAQNGEIEANFIEGMGCIGGCVGGPKAIIPKEEGKKYVDKFADDSEIKVSIDSDCMNEILDKIGIHSIEDFKDKNKIKLLERFFN
ncbi:[Fe-Fe] hydrogenase large subunit C-terminal domain-containing protein [Clostridium sp. MT-14]|uniref:4Fe-4S binding protein n=1 Tax=Clostridium aromativorans TaxID=2836848 RepID=A0ABS8N5T8_9CLOT|nr:[Fe-Fe] hydrogenase large subunit C-terminal domain-containing protein [Clostridium aromativorans]MCC9294524.1 4Fe-4S binding protein [Clostridium aromativorans]CAB1254772.1 Ferredoxin hydrogenase [Clostridiaceae bacterium BL-3]